MESYPLDWPRLSGRLCYAMPTYWRMACAEDSIDIIPARTPNGATACLISLGLVFLAGTQFALSRLPAFPEKGFNANWVTMARLITIGVALTLIVGAVVMRDICPGASPRPHHANILCKEGGVLAKRA